MALDQHKEWFLDPDDFLTTQDQTNPDKIRYPSQLEPPRGWQKKEMQEGWPEGDAPRLRCTFCRRTYAGVNAKSMWRRHVFEKHNIAMASRRDNAERKRRSSNSKLCLTCTMSHLTFIRDTEENKNVRQKPSKGSRRSPSALQHDPLDSRPKTDGPSNAAGLSSVQSYLDDDDDEDDEEQDTRNSTQVDGHDTFQPFEASSTPPLTPGRSPRNFASNSYSSIANSSLVLESPYNPLLTPAFRHSSPRHPIDQPWRFPSPSHPLHSKAHDLSLCMLMRGEGSPVVSGLDVSPVVIMPASERGKRSIFSSPLVNLAYQDKDSILDSDGQKIEGIAGPSPRRLFSENPLPVPITDRVQFKKYRVPQSPLGRTRSAGSPRNLASRMEANDSWTLGAPISPMAKRSAEGTGLLGPIELAGEDPFMDYTSWVDFPGTPNEKNPDVSPPESSVEESPVVRSTRQYQSRSQSLSLTGSQSSTRSGGSSKKSFTTSNGLVGLGPGLMDIFLDKGRSGYAQDVRSNQIVSTRTRDFIDDDDNSSSPVRRTRRPRKDLLTHWLEDDDGDCEMQEAVPPKKRRRTISEMD